MVDSASEKFRRSWTAPVLWRFDSVTHAKPAVDIRSSATLTRICEPETVAWLQIQCAPHVPRRGGSKWAPLFAVFEQCFWSWEVLQLIGDGKAFAHAVIGCG